MIDRISGYAQVSYPAATTEKTGGTFGEAFQQELDKIDAQNNSSSGLAFSKHAIARAEERGIPVTQELVEQLSDSVEKAQAKGAKNILAIDSDYAFIINVSNNRVITAMSQSEMKDNIFTNIDSAVLL